MEEQEDLLTLAEAATRFGVRQSIIKKWIEARILKTLKWSRGYTERQPSYLIPIEGNEHLFDPEPQDHHH